MARDQLRHRSRAGLLLFAVALAVAQVALYADRNLFDADRFADHTESALADPAVGSEAGAALTEQVIRARPDLIAFEPIIASVSEAVADSGAFQALVRSAAYQLHSSVFDTDADSFALTVSNTGLLLVQALEARDPATASKVPEGLRTTLLSLSDGNFGSAFTDVSQVAQDIGALGWLAVGVALLSLIMLLAPSRDRRRTVRAAGLTLVATGALMAGSLEVGRAIATGRAPDPGAEAAVAAIWDEFLRGLLLLNVGLVATGLIVAAIADARVRALSPMARVRSLAALTTAPPRTPWLRALRAAGLALVGLFLLVDPDGAVRLAVAGVGLLAVALAADEALAMAGQSSARAPASRTGRRARPIVVCVLGALALAAPVVALTATDGTAWDLEPTACNGSPELCDRRVDQVAFAATHNSMSSPDGGFLFPDQQSGISAQLDGGIRALLIDTHEGVATQAGVYTVLEPGGKSRGKLEQSVGPEATATAERLRARIGFRGGGDAEIYLCHGFCEIGAVPAERELRDVRDFLAANPGEVLVLSIEDQVSPADTEATFRASGLLDLVWTDPIEPLPTLGEMVERNRRVLVFGEEETGAVQWYHRQFDVVKETPFDVRSAEALLSPASCRLNRGERGNPLALLNHWVAKTPPLPSTARLVNSADDITNRARRCQDELGARPGLIAVDLWEEGDVVAAARSLNRR